MMAPANLAHAVIVRSSHACGLSWSIRGRLACHPGSQVHAHIKNLIEVRCANTVEFLSTMRECCRSNPRAAILSRGRGVLVVAVAAQSQRSCQEKSGRHQGKRRSSQGDQRGAIRQRCSEALSDYFLGAAATHAPFLSAPPLGSHFIFAFTQSALVVGVACAKAAGASSNAPITAATGRSFMAKLLA